MPKQGQVEKHCPKCKKSTVHDVRTINGQKTCVCLVCEASIRRNESTSRRYLNSPACEKPNVDTIIDNEVTRNIGIRWF
jgi:hypothetical protein